MATDDSLSGDGVTIYFAPVDSVGSDLATDAVQYQSFITNFDESGGEQEYESISVFGNGNVDKQKPKTQKELTFDVVMRHNSNLVDFKKIADGVGVVGAANNEVVGVIIIQQTDGSNYYYQAYNNVKAVVFDTEFAAEDEWRGTLRFKLSPTDPSGVSNEQYGAANVVTDLTAWS